MQNQYKQHAETARGRLLTFFGVWKVQTGYVTFPLAKHLQSKPSGESDGAWVAVTVQNGEVVDYHFTDENL